MPPRRRAPAKAKPAPEVSSSPQVDSSSLPEGTLCITPGCTKLATLVCPICKNLGAPTSPFCDQDCFKSYWKVHGPYHTSFKKASEFKPPLFRYTGPLRPHFVSPRVPVPKTVPLPDYAVTGYPLSEERSKYQNISPVYTPEEIAGIRAASRLGREALDFAAHMIAPGVLPDTIDRGIHDFIISRGAYPSPLNYHGFPKSVCISVNEVICHGIPDYRPLQDGDIVNIDVTVYLNGFHGDLNETYTVGKCDEESKRLIKTAHDSLWAAIKLVKPGFLFRDFGETISKVCKAEGFDVVRSYCGHGIGSLFHCAPNIPHYAKNKATGSCKPGMVFTIEPMVNAGTWEDVTWKDDWTAVTLDGKRSAQFEHMILVTEDGFEVMTERLPTSRKLWWEEEEEKEKATPEPAPKSPDAV